MKVKALGKVSLRLVGLLLLAVYLLAFNISKPFIGHHDWNGVQYGNMARNYLRYGYFDIKFGQVESAGLVDLDRLSYNTHYTPTYPLLLSLGFRVFGISEWSARLVSSVFSLMSVFLVYKIGQSLVGEDWGLVAGLLMVVTPMFRYFAKMPVHEPVVTGFCLLAIYGYVLWRNEKGKWRWFVGANLMAVLVGWPAFFLAPVLFIYDWFVYKKAAVKQFLPLFLGSVLVFLLVLMHNFWLTGDAFGGGLLNIFKFRLNVLTQEEAILNSFTFKQFLLQETRWAVVYFTLVQVLLAGWFVVSFVKDKKFKKTEGIIVAILVFGVFYAAVFRNAAFIHEYMLFYLSPGLALAAADGLKSLVRKVSVRKKYLVAGIAIVLVFIERNKFYQALEATKMHKLGKEVGEEIASVTELDDKIVIDAPQFGLHLSKFAAFYGDRRISYYNSKAQGYPLGAAVEVAIKEEMPREFDISKASELEYIYYIRIDDKQNKKFN